MLHTSNIDATSLASKVLDIPIVYGTTNGKKELEILDIAETLRKARKEFNFEAVASGGIASAYQGDRFKRIASEIGIKCVAPLWGRDQSQYLREIVSKGYSFVPTSVSAMGLDRSWLGKIITFSEVEKLEGLSRKFGFNVAFEGGEAETLVLDCPLFKKERMRIVDSSIDWYGDSGRLEIKRIEAVPK